MKFAAQIGAYVLSVLNAIDNTAVWEKIPPDTQTFDQNDKILTFSVTRKRLLFDQSESATDDPSIVDLQVTFTRSIIGGRDSALALTSALLGGAANDNTAGRPGTSQTARLNRGTITASMGIDHNQTTDLVNIWESTIRPHLIEQLRTILGAGFFSIAEEAPTFDEPNNRINVNILAEWTEGRGLIEYMLTTSIDEDTGRRLIPKWTGNRHNKKNFAGPATVIRRIRETFIEAGGALMETAGGNRKPSFVVDSEDLSRSNGWVTIRRQLVAESPVFYGTDFDNFQAVSRTFEITQEYIEAETGGTTTTQPGGGAGGGAGGNGFTVTQEGGG